MCVVDWGEQNVLFICSVMPSAVRLPSIGQVDFHWVWFTWAPLCLCACVVSYSMSGYRGLPGTAIPGMTPFTVHLFDWFSYHLVNQSKGLAEAHGLLQLWWGRFGFMHSVPKRLLILCEYGGVTGGGSPRVQGSLALDPLPSRHPSAPLLLASCFLSPPASAGRTLTHCT